MEQDLTIFDAGGNLILATNHGSYLLVSSKIMADSSPVLKRMIDHTTPSEVTPHVDITDFHTPALNFICAVLHGKDPTPWQPITTLALYNLAMACYYEFECASRTNWLLTILFESFAYDVDTVEEMLDLAAVAMICGNEPGFERLCRLLVYESTVALPTLVDRGSGMYVGKARLEKLEIQRLSIQCQLGEQLSALFIGTRCVHAGCPLVGYEAGGLIYELIRIQTWPLTMTRVGSAEILRRLGRFREPDIAIILRRTDGYLTGCDQPHGIRQFTAEVQNIVDTTGSMYQSHTLNRHNIEHSVAHPTQSVWAAQIEVRTGAGFQGHFELNGCETVELFFEEVKRIATSKGTHEVEIGSICVELPWAIGLRRAVCVIRGDKDSYMTLLKRMSEAIFETGEEATMFIANVCTSDTLVV